MLLLLSAALAAPPAAEDVAAKAYLEQVAAMKAVAAGLTDATWTVRMQEWVGFMKPVEEVAVKFRAPADIYMRWVGDESAGRELLFREGWNEGKMLVKPGPWIPSLSLDPEGRLATRNQRHTIHHISVVRTVDLVVTDTERLLADPERALQVTDLGTETLGGEPARCFRSELPKAQEPAYYAAAARVCFGQHSRLPVHIQVWDHEDGELRMVEDYAFSDFRVNVGLTDADFSPDHEAYAF